MAWLNLKALATVCGSIHFLHKFAFIQHYFFRFILFDHSCVFVLCVHFCMRACASEWGNASLPLRPSLPQIGVEWELKKKEKRSTSTRFTPSIMTAPSLPHHSFPPHSHFYSHTSQPMSSHLHSPACKLYCSVSTNDAYQQWCVFSLRWHSKYKWGIIYNSPMDLSRKQKQLR